MSQKQDKIIRKKAQAVSRAKEKMLREEAEKIARREMNMFKPKPKLFPMWLWVWLLGFFIKINKK